MDDLPYDITWSAFTSGPPQIEALNTDQIDFAVTGNTPPIAGGLTKTKVVSAYSNTAKGDAILIPQDSDISSVRDLKGKSVAVARGSSAHGHLVLQLEKAGVDVSDVNINFLQPADSKSACESGRVDAWAVWDPYTAIAEVSGAVPLITAEGVSNGYGFGVASDAALADDPAPKPSTTYLSASSALISGQKITQRNGRRFSRRKPARTQKPRRSIPAAHACKSRSIKQ